MEIYLHVLTKLNDHFHFLKNVRKIRHRFGALACPVAGRCRHGDEQKRALDNVSGLCTTLTVSERPDGRGIRWYGHAQYISMESEVCFPAAWNGILLPSPEPIHQILGRQSVVPGWCAPPEQYSWRTRPITKTGTPKTLIFLSFFVLQPFHCLPSQTFASEAFRFGRLTVLMAEGDTRISSLRSSVILTITIVPPTARNFHLVCCLSEPKALVSCDGSDLQNACL